MVTSTFIKKLSIVTAGAALVTFGIIGKAQPGTAQVITFENDTTGQKPNSFESRDSSLVSFSDTDGTDLQIRNFRSGEAEGKGLEVGFDDETSALIMEFARPVTSLSFDFGNDDPTFIQNETVYAELAISNNGTLVDTVRVVPNENNRPDQTISFSDGSFNRAVFTYVDQNGLTYPLQEVVDNVTFQPVPEPSSVLGLLTFGAFGARSLLKRKRA